MCSSHRTDADRVAALEHDPTNPVLVVDVAGVVAASAFLTICLDSMYGLQLYGVIENVIAAPVVRGRGVGLMNAIEERARAARCTKIMLLSSSSRREAQAFFQRMDFDGERKRGFVQYLNRRPAPSAGSR